MVPVVRMDVTFLEDPLCRPTLSVVVAGCESSCPGCQNPDLRDPRAGEPTEMQDLEFMMEPMLDSCLIGSVSLLGGEWGLYPEQLHHLGEFVKTRGLDVVLYTGRLYEELPEEVRAVTDWVIDGAWDETRKGIYPPSTNQRVFLHGKQVNPEELPLYQHLRDMESKVGG